MRVNLPAPVSGITPLGRCAARTAAPRVQPGASAWYPKEAANDADGSEATAALSTVGAPHGPLERTSIVKRSLLLAAFLVAALSLLALPALASAKTFFVTPIKAGPGGVVQLGAGHFYTGAIVVQGFNGTFKGAGEGKTTIDTVAGVPVPIMRSVEPVPFLVGFSGGTVSVSNMSFDITGMTPAASWYDMWGEGPVTSLGAIVLATGGASTAFDQVAFGASPIDQQDDFNARWDLAITGAQHWFTPPAVSSADNGPLTLAPTGGLDSVTRCSFTGAEGIFTDGLTAGVLMVGGSAAQQNDFSTLAGCDVRDSSNSIVTISHNLMQIRDGEGVQLYQSWFNPFPAPPPLPAPHYYVSDNQISTTGAGGGVYLEDDSEWNGDLPRLDATVSGNDIHLDNGGLDGGVDGLMVQGVKVLGNRIWGDGVAGIDVGADLWGSYDELASGWQILGNDVSGVSASDAYGSAPTAQILLGPGADGCLVVGGKAPTRVLDQGTNDTLINVSPATASLAVPSRSLGASAGVSAKLGIMRRLHQEARR